MPTLPPAGAAERRPGRLGEQAAVCGGEVARMAEPGSERDFLDGDRGARPLEEQSRLAQAAPAHILHRPHAALVSEGQLEGAGAALRGAREVPQVDLLAEMLACILVDGTHARGRRHRLRVGHGATMGVWLKFQQQVDGLPGSTSPWSSESRITRTYRRTSGAAEPSAGTKSSRVDGLRPSLAASLAATSRRSNAMLSTHPGPESRRARVGGDTMAALHGSIRTTPESSERVAWPESWIWTRYG